MLKILLEKSCYLVATALLIFAIGLYALFVEEIAMPAALIAFGHFGEKD